MKVHVNKKKSVIEIYSNDNVHSCDIYASPEELDHLIQLAVDKNTDEINNIVMCKAKERLKDELELAAHMSRSLYLNREENENII